MSPRSRPGPAPRGDPRPRVRGGPHDPQELRAYRPAPPPKRGVPPHRLPPRGRRPGGLDSLRLDPRRRAPGTPLRLPLRPLLEPLPLRRVHHERAVSRSSWPATSAPSPPRAASSDASSTTTCEASSSPTSAGDVRFHPRFLDFAQHHGFQPVACDPYRPNEKGRDREQRQVPASRNFLAGREVTDLETLNREVARWL